MIFRAKTKSDKHSCRLERRISRIERGLRIYSCCTPSHGWLVRRRTISPLPNTASYGNGKYGPTDPVTREQLAAILFRYANWKGYDTSIGEDTNILSYDDAFTWGDWAVSALQWACGTGVLEDSPVGMLRPTDDATRGEIARAVHVFCEEVVR